MNHESHMIFYNQILQNKFFPKNFFNCLSCCMERYLLFPIFLQEINQSFYAGFFQEAFQTRHVLLKKYSCTSYRGRHKTFWLAGTRNSVILSQKWLCIIDYSITWRDKWGAEKERWVNFFQRIQRFFMNSQLLMTSFWCSESIIWLIGDNLRQAIKHRFCLGNFFYFIPLPSSCMSWCDWEFVWKH